MPLCRYLAASMLAEGKVTIDHVPKLLDIDVMLNILRELGCRAEHEDETVLLDTSSRSFLPYTGAA